MSWIYILSGAIAASVFVYLVIALLWPEKFLMTANGILQLAFYLVVLIALVKPLGAYMADIYEGKPAVLNQFGAPVERLIYRRAASMRSQEMRWTQYALATLWSLSSDCWSSMGCSGCRIFCRSIPPTWGRCRRIPPSTRRSASSPTPTGKATAASPP